MTPQLGFGSTDKNAACLYCHKPLEIPPRGWRLYCSKLCSAKHRKTAAYQSKAVAVRVCPHCLTEFTNRHGKYCSKLCASRHSSAHSAFVSRRLRAAAGLCHNCGLTPPMLNRTLCESCKERKHLLKLYGITTQDYINLLTAQGGVCLICHRPPNKIALDIDHDHETGLVRGLLCRNCNTRLGWYQKYTSDIQGYLEQAARKEAGK